jgi:hypothetical protein
LKLSRTKLSKLFLEKELTEAEEAKESDEDKRARFMRATLREISCKIVCVVISQPLQV